MVRYSPNKGLYPDMIQNRDSQQQWQPAFLRKHTRIQQDIDYKCTRLLFYESINVFYRQYDKTLINVWIRINSGLHNLWTRQLPSIARAKLTIPCPGSGTCHQKGGKRAWQCPRSLSDVGCFRTSYHTRQPALTYKHHWWGSASALHYPLQHDSATKRSAGHNSPGI